MIGSELLEHIFGRLSRADSGVEVFGADEMAEWPNGAREILWKAGVLKRAQSAQVIECDGCERNCFMPVIVRPAEGKGRAVAFISCDKPEDIGRIRVEMNRLDQWQMTGGTLAGAVASLLGFANPPQADEAGKRWTLGLLKGKEGLGAVTLSIEVGVTLTLAGSQSIPLVDVLTLNKHGLNADKDVLRRMMEGDTQQPAAGVGSAAWLKQNAKAAANARHSKPGGSRDMQDRIRAAWASGKYSSRDICAEQECTALGITFSTARKALKNTPEPNRRP